MYSTHHIVNGRELNVVDEGTGDIALVFLHYWGGSARTYLPVMRLLADRFRCLAFDQRGWGRSSREGAYSLDAYAADTIALIKSLGLRKYVLVGHSMGGKVAQMVARDTPPGLLGLVLLAPAPMTPLQTPEPQRMNMLASYQSRDGVEAALTVLAHGTLPAAFREQVIEDTLCGAPEAKLMWTAVGMIEDVSPSGGPISIPTLVVVGEHDIVEPERRLRKEIPQVIPNAEFCLIAKVGHLASLEDPQAVSAAIRQFVTLLPERAEAAFIEIIQTATAH